MSSPYVGEIRMFGGNFAPAGWAFCDGATLLISENDTLFNLLGTTYGGDGQETFNLPDLRGRIPIHQGQGPGLSNYIIGQASGSETVTLTTSQIPSHNHSYQATTNPANSTNPNDGLLARSSVDIYTADLSAQAVMSPQSIGSTGGGQAHDNMMPFLVVSFIISLFGIYPSQT